MSTMLFTIRHLLSSQFALCEMFVDNVEALFMYVRSLDYSAADVGWIKQLSDWQMS